MISSSGEISHILLVIEGGYPWYYGGVSEWTSRYLHHFSDTAFTILQIATKPWKDASIDRAIYPMAENVVSFHQVTPPAVSKVSWDELRQWGARQIRQLDNLQRPDMIHITNTGLAGMLGTMLREQLEIPSVLTEHAIYWKEIQRGAQALECGFKIEEYGKSGRIEELFRSLARHTYGHADHIVSVSRSNMHWQDALGANGVEYIPNGVAESQLRSSKNLFPDGRLRVGWVGRCADIKNPLRFLRVARQMNRQLHCPLSFIMLLSDTEEKQLKREVRQKAGDIDNLAVHWNSPSQQHFDSMDMLLLTSRSESQPLVLLEALAHRVLPFGWRIGDADSRYGIFVDPETPIKELIEKVSEYRSDVNRWKEEVDERFERIKDHHLWSKVFNRYRNCFRHLMKQSQA